MTDHDRRERRTESAIAERHQHRRPCHSSTARSQPGQQPGERQTDRGRRPSADLQLTQERLARPGRRSVTTSPTRSRSTTQGPSPASGVSVSDPLPAAVTLVSATTSQGTCSGTTHGHLRPGHDRRRCGARRDRHDHRQRRARPRSRASPTRPRSSSSTPTRAPATTRRRLKQRSSPHRPRTYSSRQERRARSRPGGRRRHLHGHGAQRRPGRSIGSDRVGPAAVGPLARCRHVHARAPAPAPPRSPARSAP